MSFGVTAEGFNRKLLQDILEELTEDQRAEIHANVNTSAASPHGQLNATFARQSALMWEALEAAYHAYDADKAEDDALIALCKLTGTEFRDATFSKVECTLDLDSGATLLNGITFAAISGHEEIRFTIEEDFTAPSDGIYEKFFVAETSGAVRANAGTLTVRATTEVGWNSVTNPLDATPGNPADTNETLRARRDAEIAKSGSTTARAIRARLLAVKDVDGLQNMQQVTVVENDTDVDGLNGLPRHTIEAIVVDSPAIDDDLIAQTIYDNKAAGIGTGGSALGFALDELGNGHAIAFSRPVDRPIYLTYTLEYAANYVGDAQFKANVVAELQVEIGTGTDVFQWVAELAGRQSGVKNLNVTLGFAPAPVEELDLSILPREKAKFDTSRIVVVATPYAGN